MTPRDYQKPAIRFLASTSRGILKAPAGSGKTLIASAALADCLRRRNGIADICVLCNTVEQCEQWESAFKQFDEIEKRAKVEIGCGAGRIDPLGCDLLIVDECHRATCPSWSRKIFRAKKARWGVSATPFTGDVDRDALLIDLFTDKLYEVKRDALVSAGHLSRAAVKWIKVDPADGLSLRVLALTEELIEKRKRKMPPWFFATDQRGNPTEKHREQINQCKWQAVQQVAIWDNTERDSLITREAEKMVEGGHHVIILIGKVEHGERLAAKIPGSVLCHSGMGRKRRREAINGFKAGEIKCLVATSMLDEGFDAPIADALIVASAGKSFRKVVQSTGRVLRQYEGKERGIIVDFSDGYNSMLSRQAQKRKSIYRELKYQNL